MRVIIQPQAEADLEEIVDYIARDAPLRAFSFARELRERCESLADMALAFPLVPRYEHKGVRRRPHGNYLIFYRVAVDQIDVLHVLNGAQDYEAVLFPAE